jgi:hypothetical protein
MERADDAIGMAKAAVANRSKTAKNKFFIELLEMYGSGSGSQTIKSGLTGFRCEPQTITLVNLGRLQPFWELF